MSTTLASRCVETTAIILNQKTNRAFTRMQSNRDARRFAVTETIADRFARDVKAFRRLSGGKLR